MENIRTKKMRSLRPISAFVLLLLLILLGCERKSPPEKAREEAKPAATKREEINLKETRLTVIPEDYEQWSNISFSADGRQVFYKARKKGREFIVAASTSGENIGSAYESVSWLVKSADGRRFAFGGKTRGKKRLVVDNKELKSSYHEEVAPAAFSTDGRFVACEVGGLKEKKWFIVVSDGEKEVYRSQAYPHTFRPPVFSPNSRLLVYELGEKNKKSTVFFLDLINKKIIKERFYTEYATGRFSFSSESLRVIYNIAKEGSRYLVLMDFALNEERKVELPFTSTGQSVLSPDGKQIVYNATKGGKHFLVVSKWESPAKGKESGPYEGIGSIVYGPDSSYAYHAMNRGKWRIVVGSKESAAKYDAVGDAPVFSPDGAKIVYAANMGGHQERTGLIGGKWVMVVSPTDKPTAVKEGPAYDMVVSPLFSPDGRRIAYRARKGPMENAKRFIVIADTETGKVIKEGPAGDEIWPPVWSADGKCVGYGARIGRELWWKVQTLP